MEPEIENTLNKLSLNDLCTFIVNKHHSFEQNELSLLKVYLNSAVKIDGGKFPEIGSLKDAFDKMYPVLENHLKKEKHLLFPISKELQEESSFFSQDTLLLIKNSVEQLIAEHGKLEKMLAEMKLLINAPRLKNIVSPTGKLCLLELTRLYIDVEKMFAKEEEILFPKLLELVHFHNGEKVKAEKNLNEPGNTIKKNQTVKPE
ncbi:MAG: hemerythrin domain-containing protein [Bacteroidia bacterium]|nr:hemerythrin domain-containing protein [Bacteroidia bacterium]